MNQDEFNVIAREIHILFTLTTKILINSVEQHLNECGIGVNGLQYGLMHMLKRQPYTLSELSKKFLLDPSTLVPVVDTLERKGLVQRTRDPNDRRRVPLSLTEEGEKLVMRESPFNKNDVLIRGLNNLGEENVKQLHGLLRELMRQMPDGEEILQEVASRVQHMQSRPDLFQNVNKSEE
jgi:DNA-binding MarR family transcriptional regulator